MIADELFATYQEFYHLGPDDVAVHMRGTYQFHVDARSDSMNNRHGQQDGEGHDNGVPNQPVLNEVVQPQQDARTVRANRSDAVRKS